MSRDVNNHTHRGRITQNPLSKDFGHRTLGVARKAAVAGVAADRAVVAAGVQVPLADAADEPLVGRQGPVSTLNPRHMDRRPWRWKVSVGATPDVEEDVDDGVLRGGRPT